jgi:hypothetical protein
MQSAAFLASDSALLALELSNEKLQKACFQSPGAETSHSSKVPFISLPRFPPIELKWKNVTNRLAGEIFCPKSLSAAGGFQNSLDERKRATAFSVS